MSRLLHIMLCVLLSFRLAVADPASTFLRSSKSSSLAKSPLSALLVRRGKLSARQGEWCPSGYGRGFAHQVLRNTDPTPVLCDNSNLECALIGFYCVRLTDEREPFLL
jgi:hypothetical protein